MDINLKEVDISALIKNYKDFVKNYSEYTESIYPRIEETGNTLIKDAFLIHSTNYETFQIISDLILKGHIYDSLCLIRPLYESVLNLGLLASNTVTGGLERYSEFGWIKIYDYIKCLDSISDKELELPNEFNESISNFIKKYYPKNFKAWINKKSTKGIHHHWAGMNSREISKELDKIYTRKFDKVFFERRYCVINNLISNMVHRNVAGFEATYLPKMIGNTLVPVHNIDIVNIAIRESLIVYLTDLYFLDKILKKVENSEEYYEEQIDAIAKVFGY